MKLSQTHWISSAALLSALVSVAVLAEPQLPARAFDRASDDVGPGVVASLAADRELTREFSLAGYRQVCGADARRSQIDCPPALRALEVNAFGLLKGTAENYRRQARRGGDNDIPIPFKRDEMVKLYGQIHLIDDTLAGLKASDEQRAGVRQLRDVAVKMHQALKEVPARGELEDAGALSESDHGREERAHDDSARERR